MNTSTRFRHLIDYQPADRVPRLEVGLRDEVLECWQAQGMAIAGCSWHRLRAMGGAGQ